MNPPEADYETGNPLVADAACGAGLSGAQASANNLAVLLGVLGYRFLRRTINLGTNTLRLSSGTPIFVVSRHQFMKHPG